MKPLTTAALPPALRKHLRPDIEVSELPMELNSPGFAEVLVTGVGRDDTGIAR